MCSPCPAMIDHRLELRLSNGSNFHRTSCILAECWLRKQSQRQHHSRLLTRCATGKAARDLSTTGGTTFSAETMIWSRACRLWPRKASRDGCDGVRGVPRQLWPSCPASAGLNARVWTASIICHTMKN